MAEIEPVVALSAPAEATEAESKRRTRRGSRGGRSRRRGEPGAEGSEEREGGPIELEPEAAIEVAPVVAPEAKPRTRRRTKPAAEIAPETDQAEAVPTIIEQPAGEEPKKPSRSRRAKAVPEETPSAEERPPAEAKKTPPAPVRAVPSEPAATATILKAVEQQQKQIDQLVRLHEDLARRVGSHGPVAASAPPARVGVFVDAANIELACDRLRARFDWKKILEMVTKDRILVRAIAYSPVHDDPGVSIETQRFVEPFLDKGFKVVTKPLKRFADGTIKANVDIELALDVIEMLDRLDVVVLASGDGDFQRLVEVLQAKGIRVEVISVGASTASNLRHAADKFIDLQSKLREIRAG